MALQDHAFRLTAHLPVSEEGYRADHLLVAPMVEPGSGALALGCLGGDRLRLLEERGVAARGLELSRKSVNSCFPNNKSAGRGGS